MKTRGTYPKQFILIGGFPDFIFELPKIYLQFPDNEEQKTLN